MSDETVFLTAIQDMPTDNTSRLVYADWLDEHDRLGGEFLRVECEFSALAPTDPRRSDLQAKLREASRGINPGWLTAVSRVSVENCGVEFRFRCPKRWEQLQPTVEEGVRFCGQCRQ